MYISHLDPRIAQGIGLSAYVFNAKLSKLDEFSILFSNLLLNVALNYCLRVSMH